MQLFNQAKAAGKEVFRVIERKPTIYTNQEGKQPDAIKGSIDINDVHFSYPSRMETPILRGFSLSIPAGKVVAFVGSSGCGKSTIMSLITRFYDPIEGVEDSKTKHKSVFFKNEETNGFWYLTGVILIDNYNIKDLDLKFLRRNIGVVSQEPALFSGNIKDNIRAGNWEADDSQLQKAAQMANAHSFICEFPNQYSTEVR